MQPLFDERERCRVRWEARLRERCRARDGWLRAVSRHRAQHRPGVACAGVGSGERHRHLLVITERPFAAVPCGRALRRPARVASRVTARAGVRRAERDGEIRPRNAQAVIASRIDHHVRCGRHVAADACRPRARNLMMVMGGRVVLRRQVAGRAHCVALGAQLSAVRVVTIAARHAARLHPALQERPPDVHLIALLSVGMVQRSAEQCRAIVVEKRLASLISVLQSDCVASDIGRTFQFRARWCAPANEWRCR